MGYIKTFDETSETAYDDRPKATRMDDTIEMRFARQQEIIIELGDAVDRLGMRIAPILNPPSPMTHDPNARGEDVPEMSDMARMVSDRTDSIRLILHKVGEMTARVDL